MIKKEYVLQLLVAHRNKGNLVDGYEAIVTAIRSMPEEKPVGWNAAVAVRHPHYHKPVHGLEFIDVYRVLTLFNVTDPCLQHAIKKLLVAGGRGAGKDIARDVKEAVDCLLRWQEMRNEETAPLNTHSPLSTRDPISAV